MMRKRHFGATAICLAMFQGLLGTPAFAEIREVVIVGTFKTPSGKLEEVVYETNAEYYGCRNELRGLRISMQIQIQGYQETAGWMLQDARCAFQTKDGAIEEFDTR